MSLVYARAYTCKMGDVSTNVMSASYNSNSPNQLAAVFTSADYISQAIDVFSSTSSLTIIVDYGASHGLNSLRAVETIIKYLREKKKVVENQQVLVVHNDLPSNDWSSLFQVLAENSAYYGVASGRSFYEQCLPQNSLAIGYSSSSLHWLSQKPCNFSKHCWSTFVPDDDPERVAFARQSSLDYAHFFEHRSRELVQGGVLILSIPSSNFSKGISSSVFIDTLYQCAQVLLTSSELLNYTFPVHVRSYDECVDHALFSQYLLELIKAEHIEIQSLLVQQFCENAITVKEFVRSRTLAMRSWPDAVLQQALATNEEKDKVTSQFWAMYEQRIAEQPNEY